MPPSVARRILLATYASDGGGSTALVAKAPFKKLRRSMLGMLSCVMSIPSSLTIGGPRNTDAACPCPPHRAMTVPYHAPDSAFVARRREKAASRVFTPRGEVRRGILVLGRKGGGICRTNMFAIFLTHRANGAASSRACLVCGGSRAHCADERMLYGLDGCVLHGSRGDDAVGRRSDGGYAGMGGFAAGDGHASAVIAIWFKRTRSVPDSPSWLVAIASIMTLAAALHLVWALDRSLPRCRRCRFVCGDERADRRRGCSVPRGDRSRVRMDRHAADAVSGMLGTLAASC